MPKEKKDTSLTHIIKQDGLQFHMGPIESGPCPLGVWVVTCIAGDLIAHRPLMAQECQWWAYVENITQ